MSEWQHGMLLLDQGRYDEAEACFIGVLTREPENDFVYSRLSLCRMEMEGRKNDALSSIDEAIRIEPEVSMYRSIRALILCELNRGKDALTEADQAVALDPEDDFAAGVKASAYCELQKWSDAEDWARRALSLNSDSTMAANILTHTLRLQGKSNQNEAAVSQLLADDPNSSLAHVNAGWTALHQGDSRKAEEHFREALRLDPEMEAAREGLLESFKARSWFYRGYLRYCFFMQRFTEGKQWLIIIGLYVVYQVLRRTLKEINPLLAGGLVFLWLGFIMWIWLAPGIGNFLVFLDRSARLALKPGEKWHGIAVGGGLLIGVMALVTGFIWKQDPLLALGMGAIIFTVPASLTFDNESTAGRWIFGLLTAYTFLATCGVMALEWLHGKPGILDASWGLALPAIIGAILCTWLGNVPALRRGKAK